MFAQQMLATVVGWDLYLSTHSPVVLGNVGLVQIIPVLLFTIELKSSTGKSRK